MEKQDTQKLKGLAIILVILYHFHYGIFGGTFLMDPNSGINGWIYKVEQYYNYRPDLIWGLLFCFGFIGVHIFITLSGFGLTKKYLTQDKFSFKSWGKQIWKMLLPYFIALPVTHLINYALQNVLFWAGKIASVPAFFDIYKPQQYLESIIVPTRWFTAPLALNFVGTWWFVGIILQFYLVYPLLLWLLKKFKPLKFLIITFVITIVYRALIAIFTNYNPIGVNMADPVGFINFPARLAEFALGMYFATRKDWKLFKGQYLVGVLMILIGLFAASYRIGVVVSDILIAVGLVFTFDTTLKIFNKVLSKFFNWLGEKSYYIFLYHEPAMSMIVRLLVTLPL